jgi:perosamine synthetase
MPSGIHRRDLIAGAVAAACASRARADQPAAVAPTPTPAIGARPSAGNSAVERAATDWPVWDASEEQALLEVLHSGKWGRTAGGRALKDFEAAFAAAMQAKHCLATSSGTTALLTTLGALGIGPGDEVILPPYTFVATFNAITGHYALPVFVDSDLETFQIDDTKVESAITDRTRVLLPVHIGGAPANLDALTAIAARHELPMIEDACQAHLASWRGRVVGTRGLGGCFSFQASKNLTAGDGGAIVTDDEHFARRCLAFHAPGNDAGLRLLGRGANYRMTEFQAGLLLAQLVRLERQTRVREANATYLSGMLREIPGIEPQRLLEGCTRSAWHLYMFRYDARQFRDLPREEFLKRLGRAGVMAGGGYTSLNRSPHAQALATNPHYLRIYGKDRMERWAAQACPVNDRLCGQAVWLTQRKLLGGRQDMERIAEAIAAIQKG